MENNYTHCEYLTIKEKKYEEFNTDKYVRMKSNSNNEITYAFEFMLLADDLKRIHGLV